MEKTKLFTVAAACICLTVIIGGCAKTAKKTGFLSSYAKLEPVSETRMRYIAPNELIVKYSKFVIEPVETKFYDTKTSKNIQPEDIKHLEEYFHMEIVKQKPDRYQIVSMPGQNVARLRIAITNLEKSTPALNVLPQTKLTGVGLGQASVEAELVDSQTGQQIAAVIDSETGSRFSFSGLSKWGDVEAVMKDWAKRLWLRVDEAHGIARQ